jgi:hypothetical protein
MPPPPNNHNHNHHSSPPPTPHLTPTIPPNDIDSDLELTPSPSPPPPATPSTAVTTGYLSPPLGPQGPFKASLPPVVGMGMQMHAGPALGGSDAESCTVPYPGSYTTAMTSGFNHTAVSTPVSHPRETPRERG